MKKILRNNSGITLIALVITIIVLLILAGVSIAMLTGDNGILTQAQNAKEKNVIGEEKEKVSLAATASMTRNYGDGIEEEIFTEELEKLIGKKGEAWDYVDFGMSDNYKVKYLDTKRIYQVNSYGKVEYEEIEEVVDSTPGEIAGAGTEDDPYRIESIEDLATLSKNVGSGKDYYKEYIEINTNLDFKSELSYVNPEALTYIDCNGEKQEYGDINYDGKVEGIMKEVTTGRGFESIGGQYFAWGGGYENPFNGYFNGNGHSISNLYINTVGVEKSGVGLFGSIVKFGQIENLNLKNVYIAASDGGVFGIGGICGVMKPEEGGMIKNCSVSGDILINEYASEIGGIVGAVVNTNIFDCINYSDIKATKTENNYDGRLDDTGGIAGHYYTEYDDRDRKEKMKNCKNYGNIISNDESSEPANIGGIAGRNYTYIIEKCSNYGNINIKNGFNIGGIAGYAESILECVNNGKISGESAQRVAGIAGENLTVNKCANNGEILGKEEVGGITGILRYNTMICNSYNKGKVIGNIRVGGIAGVNGSKSSVEDTTSILNSYNIGEVNGKDNVGGIAGLNYSSFGSKIINSYSINQNIVAAYTNDGGEKIVEGLKPSEEMKKDDFLNILNVDNVWKKDSKNINQGFPILSWQEE